MQIATQRSSLALAIALGAAALAPASAVQAKTFETAQAKFQVQVLADGLEHPWGMAFLPDGALLITERPGGLRLFRDGALQAEPLSGLPEVWDSGQGGLLDVTLHPDFPGNPWVYLSYAKPGEGGAGTAVGRGKLEGNGLRDFEVIFELPRKTGRGQHFGSRLVFDREGYLFATIGERGERDRAQDPHDPAGSVLRIHDDGTIPEDNPFADGRAGHPAVYSYGHRNPQGMALHPETGELWVQEHGPQGGDEVNLPRKGGNFGWPVVTHGEEYGGGDIGPADKPGFIAPVFHWTPSIAPSGMAFYDGTVFPEWQGDLFNGSLKFQLVSRLELDGDEVREEERFLEDAYGRIRDIEMGPDGFLYLLTDSGNGLLLRIEPAN
ncbi:MAG: PQQ-dependent sugar dehydrogenase [Rhodovibrionaceae bacterium]